jgi:predicted HicB family RNase H-like nuclease
MKRLSDRYLKVVEWSEEDNCYIGTSPGLFMGGIHGDDQTEVFLELSDVIEEIVALFESEGKSLPAATANKSYSGNISLRIPPELHKTIAIRATQEGTSVNKFIQLKLEASTQIHE